jgi:excisionase family DNA binding protein
MAERLGLPVSWVRTKEREGVIPSYRSGKYVRFDEEEVKAALKAGLH